MLSQSGVSRYYECPTRYYWARLHAGTGIERIYEGNEESDAKYLQQCAKLSAQVRSACVWIAQTERPDFTTLACELLVECADPALRLWLDQLIWLHDEDALAVRDHKFTFKDDSRVLERTYVEDQFPLYGAVWNRTMVPQGYPRVDYFVPNVIVVRANGQHMRMPGERIFFDEAREEFFWQRIEHAAREIHEFEATVAYPPQLGKLDPRLFMRPSACIAFSRCAFIDLCHRGVEPESSSFRPSERRAGS